MKKTILTIFVFAVFIALASFASASAGISLFYEDTNSNSYTIEDGQEVGFLVSSYGFLEDYIITDVDLLDSSEGKLVDLIDATTNAEGNSVSYSNEKYLTEALYGGPGDYIIRATVTGSLGGTSTANLYLIVEEEIIEDTTPPVITLLGNNPEEVTVGTSYTDAGATAYDNVDGDITSDIVVVNPVNVNNIGTYIVTYNVQDSSGNNAQEVTRTVNVVEGDVTAPNINVITPEDGEEYDESELTFEIEVDEDADVTFSLDGDDEISMNYQGTSNGILIFAYDVELDDGDHEVTFYATDTSGNVAEETVEFEIDTDDDEDDDEDSGILNYYQSDYEEELYLNQFKRKTNTINLEDDENTAHLNWFQRFIAWLKRIFGFD